MKPKLFTAIILFTSAYSPLFIILIVKNYDFESNRLSHPYISIVLLLMIIISIILTFISLKKIVPGSMVVKITEIENRSGEFINYTIPYLLSFLGDSLKNPADIFALCLFLLVLFIISVKSQTLFINPILIFFGYGYYDVTYEFEGKVKKVSILSKVEMLENESYYIRSISKYLFFLAKPYEE